MAEKIKSQLKQIVNTPIVKDISSMSSVHLAAVQDATSVTPFMTNRHRISNINFDMINQFYNRKSSLRRHLE